MLVDLFDVARVAARVEAQPSHLASRNRDVVCERRQQGRRGDKVDGGGGVGVSSIIVRRKGLGVPPASVSRVAAGSAVHRCRRQAVLVVVVGQQGREQGASSSRR